MAAPSIGNIVARIGRLDLIETLKAIHRFAYRAERLPGRTIQKDVWDQRGGIYVRVHVAIGTNHLATLTKFALAHCSLEGGEIPNDKEMLLLGSWIGELPSAFTEEPVGAIGLDELYVQLAYQQFQFQTGGSSIEMGRTLVLFRDISAGMTSPPASQTFDLMAEFESFAGMSMERFMWCGHAVYGATRDAAVVNLRWKPGHAESMQLGWHGDLDHMPTAESIKVFVSLVSRTPEEFREEIGDLRAKDPNLLAFDFMPLLSHPVVRLDNDQVIVPVPKLLADRITSGIFHDFSEHIDGKGRNTPFRDYFGYLFEEYVHGQLLLVFDESELIPETDYGKPGQRTPDWTVNDPQGLVAIECRTSGLNLLTRQTGEWARIKADMHQIGSIVLKNLEGKKTDIAATETPIDPASLQDIRGVLCTWESMWRLGAYGRLIHQTLEEEGIGPFEFHLLPIDWLERICAMGSKEVFYEAIDLLKVDTSWDDQFGGQPEDRLERLIPHDLPVNPILHDASEQFFDALP